MLLLITAGLQIRQDGAGIFIAALQMLLLITAGLQIRQDGLFFYKFRRPVADFQEIDATSKVTHIYRSF